MIRAALVTLGSAVLIAGCGQSSQTTSASTSNAKAPSSQPGTTTTPAPATQAPATQAPATQAPATQATTARPAAAKGTLVKLVSSQYGRIVGDSRGQAFYLFTRDGVGPSQCYGQCARRWPPAYAKGRPQAGTGARGRLLGTTRRRDGKLQLTYAGHPLYYYDADGPGRVLCQAVDEFGGTWLVVRATGKPLR